MSTLVRSGYSHAKPATVAELTCRLEAARQETRQACSRYTRLRAAVLDYLHAEGYEQGGPYRTRLRAEVGRGSE